MKIALSRKASVLDVAAILSRHRLEWDQDRRVMRIQ